MRPLHVVLLLGVVLATACCRGGTKGSPEAQALESDTGAGGATAPPPPEGPNGRLERQVRAKLFGDPELAGSGSIAIIVDGGRVVLEGWVSSVNERTLAEADAATVAGVVTVDNRLVVRGVGPGSQ